VTLSLYLNLGLKLTYLILHTANWPALPVPLKLRHYGAIQMYYYCYNLQGTSSVHRRGGIILLTYFVFKVSD